MTKPAKILSMLLMGAAMISAGCAAHPHGEVRVSTRDQFYCHHCSHYHPYSHSHYRVYHNTRYNSPRHHHYNQEHRRTIVVDPPGPLPPPPRPPRPLNPFD
ncbi:MAG TPA: hypothetical protein VGH19_03915 [Verrucomicrobiae bacterium]